MAPELYVLTTRIGGASRSQLWSSGEMTDLDLPGGWVIEMQDGNIHIYDSAADKGDDTAVGFVVDPIEPGKKVALELPPSARERWRRAITIEVGHVIKPDPVYIVSSDAETLKKAGPKQPFLFYGQDFLLVHHRPVSLTHEISLLGYNIFTYSQDESGHFIVKSYQNGLQVETDAGLVKIPKGSEVRLSNAEFFGCTFRLRKHWWRLRLFPSADGLEPVETDETEEDLQEKERLQSSMMVSLFLFSFLILGGYIFARFNRPPPKIVSTTVVLKTPKIIPEFKAQKKPEVKKPKKKKKKKIVVVKRHRVIELKKHPVHRPRPKPQRIVRRVRKRVAHVRKEAVAAAPRPIVPHHVTPQISPAVARAKELARERAAQQAQVMKSLKFLSSSSSLPQENVAYYKTKKGEYANTAMVGGMQSKSNALDRIAKDAPGSGVIHTRSAQEISSNIKFGRRGKGLNHVQGRVSLSELNGGGGTLSGALSGGSGIFVSGPGTMSDGLIEKILQKYLSRFEYCYEKSLLSDSSLSGNLLVQWDITTSGSVSHSQVLKSQLNNAQLHHCILHVLGGIHFPPPKGGYVTVKKTFSFASSSI